MRNEKPSGLTAPTERSGALALRLAAVAAAIAPLPFVLRPEVPIWFSIPAGLFGGVLCGHLLARAGLLPALSNPDQSSPPKAKE